MHIITGLVLTGLMGRLGKDKAVHSTTLRSPILRAPTVLSVVHSLPGRTRFRVPRLCGDARTAAAIEETLQGIEGVRSVAVSHISATVLVEHDAERIAPEVVAAALIRVLGLENEITRDVEAALARELREFSRAANRAVYEKTGGLLDFKTALFLVLAFLGARKMLQQGTLALPAGFTLLWWAGNGLLRGRQTAS